MPAVGVFFQSGVDPVHKGIPLLLCSDHHTGISELEQNHSNTAAPPFIMTHYRSEWLSPIGNGWADTQMAQSQHREATAEWRDTRAARLTGERMLCAFTRKLGRPSNGQDAFFSVEDLAEGFCYLAAPQLLNYLTEDQRILRYKCACEILTLGTLWQTPSEAVQYKNPDMYVNINIKALRQGYIILSFCLCPHANWIYQLPIKCWVIKNREAKEQIYNTTLIPLVKH